MNTTGKVIMGSQDVNGTSLQGYFPDGTRYAELVEVFGKPNADTDEYKVDAEWNGIIDGKVFTIYNYKTGKNYNGASGDEVEDITDWHIGGREKVVAELLVDYFLRMVKPKSE